MNPINKTARIAGVFYLLYIVTTILADVLGRSRVMVVGDAAATAANITGSARLIRLSFLLAIWSPPHYSYWQPGHCTCC